MAFIKLKIHSFSVRWTVNDGLFGHIHLINDRSWLGKAAAFPNQILVVDPMNGKPQALRGLRKTVVS
ncbi:MAG: hypothetical protein A2W33_10430 [Chloroflexi bacterium RBG_16_52_11]|nr:MAG: hypothetical protein A2W33_10430 [Chloroflexi bacterium RBG_16_52_11]